MAENVRAALQEEVRGLSLAHRGLLRAKVGRGRRTISNNPKSSYGSGNRHLGELAAVAPTAIPQDQSQPRWGGNSNNNSTTTTNNNNSTNNNNTNTMGHECWSAWIGKGLEMEINVKDEDDEDHEAQQHHEEGGKQQEHKEKQKQKQNDDPKGPTSLFKLLPEGPAGVFRSPELGLGLQELYQSEAQRLARAHRLMKEKLRSDRGLVGGGSTVARGAYADQCLPHQSEVKFKMISKAEQVVAGLEDREKASPTRTSEYLDQDPGLYIPGAWGRRTQPTKAYQERNDEEETEAAVLRARLEISESLISRAAIVSARAASKALEGHQKRTEVLQKKLHSAEECAAALRTQCQQSEDQLAVEQKLREALERTLAHQRDSDQHIVHHDGFQMRRRPPGEVVEHEVWQDTTEDGRVLLASATKRSGIESTQRPTRSPAAEAIYLRNELTRMETELESQSTLYEECRQQLEELRGASGAEPPVKKDAEEGGIDAAVETLTTAKRKEAFLRRRQRHEEEAESDRLWLLSSGSTTGSPRDVHCPIWKGGRLLKLCAKNGRWQERFIILDEASGSGRKKGRNDNNNNNNNKNSNSNSSKSNPQSPNHSGRTGAREWRLRWSKVGKGNAPSSQFTALPLADVVHIDFGPHLLPERLKPPPQPVFPPTQSSGQSPCAGPASALRADKQEEKEKEGQEERPTTLQAPRVPVPAANTKQEEQKPTTLQASPLAVPAANAKQEEKQKPTLLALYTSQRAFHFATTDDGLLEALLVACSHLSPNLAPIQRRSVRLFRARQKLGEDTSSRVKSMLAAILLVKEAKARADEVSGPTEAVEPEAGRTEEAGAEATPASPGSDRAPHAKEAAAQEARPVSGIEGVPAQAIDQGKASRLPAQQQPPQHEKKRQRRSGEHDDEGKDEANDGDEDEEEEEEEEEHDEDSEEEDAEEEDEEQQAAPLPRGGSPSPNKSLKGNLGSSPKIQDADELDMAS